ncbi:hypothetical protein [Pedomonas sp. V897]|uniref:hypothetical protein n=1 Tax=Pedomonas sp. V897 TaxID=3446482 RepID=UPI003EE1505A
MVKLGDYEQSDWAVGRTYLSYDADRGKGVYRHPLGLVQVDTIAASPIRATCLRLIHEGREYSRRWEAIWGERTIARLCREFIEEVTAPPGSE